MNAPQPKPYLAQIAPYKAGKTSRARDVTPIKLSSNENPYGCSPKARQAYMDAANTLHRYPEGSCAELRAQLATIHHVQPENLLCGAGSDELIGLIVHTYAGVGDEVLFTEHAFLMYKIYTLAAGATPVEVDETNLRANVDALLAGVTERTKIVFIANPNNPTGSYLSSEELADLRTRLPAHILLVIDAAYAECAEAPDYADGAALAKSTHNTVMLRTFSKLYGLPFLRLGWMMADATIVDAVSRIKSPFNVNGAAQAAGLAALKDAVWFDDQYHLNLEGKHALIKALRDLGLHAHDSEGNFTLVDCGDVEHAQKLVQGLEAQHIYVRDVSSYKLPTCMRISVGRRDQNQRLIDALKGLL